MPFFFIFSGISMFLLGALMLPVMTLAWEQDLTEKQSFAVPGAQTLEVEKPTVLALYDLSMQRPDKRIQWDKLRLRASLTLVNQSSGEIIPLTYVVDDPKIPPADGRDLFGYFEVKRPGTWLLVVPQEILPEEAVDANIHWSLRPPPEHGNTALGLMFLGMAILGALMSLLGLFMLIIPKIFAKKLDDTVTE
jgi:hypothetical protein